jgi:hypothetical protein
VENLTRALAVALAVSSMVGCGPPAVGYIATPSTKPASAKGPGCDVEVTATLPAAPHEEVGTFRVGLKGGSARATSDPAEFKRAIEADACRLGADVVVVQVNGDGDIIRGTALRRISAP